MKTVKRSIAAALADLDQRVPRAVGLLQQIEELQHQLNLEKTLIREALGDANAQHHTAQGCEALLVEEERLAWNVDKLLGIFSEEENRDKFCPRKPCNEALRAMLEATVDPAHAKQLRAAARASHSTRLELRAAAELVIAA